MRVVVLGAGFGGLEVTTRLSEVLGDDVDLVLIDRTDSFVFGFSKLEVMFGRAAVTDVRHAYSDLLKPGVHFVQATVQSIDPVAKRVETDAGHEEEVEELVRLAEARCIIGEAVSTPVVLNVQVDVRDATGVAVA